MKTKTSNRLKLIGKGMVSLREAKRAANYVLKEMSKGDPIELEQHGSDTEGVFVFIANGLCCTMHLQPLEKKGGKR